MTRRVTASAAAAVFLLLAAMVHLLVDFHDRSSPIALTSPPRLTVESPDDRTPTDAALAVLRRVDAQTGVGLVKQGADLSGGTRGVVLLPVTRDTELPRAVERYGEAPMTVVGLREWRHTSVPGTYFATGDTARLSRAIADLERAGLKVQRTDTTVGTGLSGMLMFRSLLLAFVTVSVLLATVVLYWLAVKSRRRALRVLAGTPVGRIQCHDLTQLLLLFLAVAVPVFAVATVVVGAWKGWVYTPVFAAYVGVLGLAMLAVAMVAALIMSAISVPSPALLASRKPATVGVRRASGVLKGVTFLLVLLVMGPAWTAWGEASEKAEQLNRWELLSGYVAVNPGLTGEAEMSKAVPRLVAMVREAEREGSLLLSDTYVRLPHAPEPNLGSVLDDLLGERWAGVGLVNQRWLEVMVDGAETGLAEVPPGELPPAFLDEMARSVVRKEALARIRFLAPRGDPVPLLGSELAHRDDVLLAVVPSVVDTFNDRMVSELGDRGLLFSGFDETQGRLDAHGLSQAYDVRHAAENEILLAKYATHEAWLNAAALVGLGIALALAGAISARIAALLEARNDFVRRLSGHPWAGVVSGRLLPELAIGTVVTIGVALLLKPPEEAVVTLAAGAVLLAASPVMHVAAVRLSFGEVAARRL